MVMRRRQFIATLGSAAAMPFATRAQQPAMPVIGYFSTRSPETDGPMLTAFRQGLDQGGYTEGKNVAIEFRWALGHYDRLPAMAEELAGKQVTVIVTSGGETAALAAKAATSKTPIVFIIGDDPVRFGLVSSLNHPGGNLTGVTSFLFALNAKKLGLLRELAPGATAIGFLANPGDPGSEGRINDIQAAAGGQKIIVLKAGSQSDIDAAFAKLVAESAGALLMDAGPFFVTQSGQIIELAARHKIPTMYFRRELAVAGGLISYGSSTVEGYRKLGAYAAKILRGEDPANLPVSQPTKFELVINLKTAKTLGVAVPPPLLARADEVIE
jgi:putative ABC transport system substrate-binding protein